MNSINIPPLPPPLHPGVIIPINEESVTEGLGKRLTFFFNMWEVKDKIYDKFTTGKGQTFFKNFMNNGMNRVEMFGEFERITGCPILVNTSFNIQEEPIVCNPKNAFKCFMNNDLDILVIENFFLLKEDQINNI